MDSRDDSLAVFHEGELRAQAAAGVRERMAQVGPAVIRDYMPDQHREFFRSLPLLYVGSLDAGRRPWASVLWGTPGFVHSDDPRRLRVDALPGADDPWSGHLAVDAPIGILGLEASTRRRNRMNGTVLEVDAGGFTVGVDLSFGNCPQYIQERSWSPRDRGSAPAAVEHLGPALDREALAMIGSADTCFIASASPDARARAGAEGVDVSHRGGLPGFVRAGGTDACVLSIPDFRGNFLFNTIGNLLAWPRAGLLFVDYASGDVLQLTGHAAVVGDAAVVASFPGAQRVVEITVEEARRRRAALPFDWSEPHYASQLAGTGPWAPGPHRAG